MCTENAVVVHYVNVGLEVCREDWRILSDLNVDFQVATFLPRRTAAHILAVVANHGDYGGVSVLVTPEMIGAAIRRLVRNYTEDESWRVRFLKGFEG